MHFVIDSREQQPYTFDRWPEVKVCTAKLDIGDYSILGLENHIAVERKSLPDLIQCLYGKNRERFERELKRASILHRFFVIYEGSLDDIAQHNYRSQIKPHSVMQTIYAFVCRYNIPFLPCDNRSRAEYTAFSILRHYSRDIIKKHKELEAYG